jgi:hypothetical protein
MDGSATVGTGGARGVVMRGVIAGAVAATVLAVWFLVIDGIAGRPFYTPGFLARVVLGGEAVALSGGAIALYTVLHYGVFILLGIGVSWVRDRLAVAPGVLLGAVLGFLLFDLLFYGSVWLTGVDVVSQLGWPQVLTGNIIAGVTLLSMLNLLGPQHALGWGEVLAEHRTLREGLVVGLLGAGAVAIWFLVIDLGAGRLLFTPAALGSVIFHGATQAADVQVNAVTVLAYTGLHVAAFLVTGLVAAAIVVFAEDRHAYVLLGAVMLFVTFETFFIGVLTIVAQWLLEVIPWWSIAVANLIAAVVMAAYLWRRHPKLARALADPELERNVEAPQESDRGLTRAGPTGRRV